jgi:hypothetical protein
MSDSNNVYGQTLFMSGTTPQNLLNHVLAPVQQCLGVVSTSCQESLLGDENAASEVEKLLPDLKKEGKSRSTALQQLYMLTSAQHESNR